MQRIVGGHAAPASSCIASAMAAAVLLASAPAIHAQEAQRARNTIIEEVTVTARKREERVIDAPVAVSVLSAEAIERYNTRSLTQLTERMPGVQITEGSGGGAGGNITIRGIGKPPGTSDYGIDQPVALVMDGMAFTRGHMLKTGFFDIQAVEVLKGPQALYFGKNSPAGVIAVTSISPEVGGEMGGFLRAQYEFVTEDPAIEAGFDLPVGDHWAFRLAARGQDMEGGWLDNNAQPLPVSDLYPGTDFRTRGKSYDEYPAQEQALVRLTSVWEPTTNFSAELKNFRSFTKRNNGGTTILWACADGPGAHPYYTAFPDPTQICPDREADLDNSNAALPPAQVVNEHPFLSENSRFHDSLEQWVHTLEMNWDIGDFTVTSLSGYWDYEQDEYTNYDYTSYAVVVSEQGEEGKSFSQELRLQSNFAGPLNFMLGLFYEDSERDLDAPVQILPAAFFAPGEVPYQAGQFPGDEFYDGTYINYHQHWTNDIESFSAFASMDWQVTERWSVSGGLRYTEEDRESFGGNIFENSGFLGFSPAQVFYAPEDKSDNISPELTVSYSIGDDATVYAAYKTGFQSAGISNPGTVPNLDPTDQDAVNDALVFDETTIEGFELGLKGYFLDGRMRADLAAFTYEMEDLQVGIFNSNTTTFTLQNAAVAENHGAELDVVFQATERLQLRAAGAWNHLEFDEWDNAGCHPVDGALPFDVLNSRDGPECHIGPNGVPIQDLSGKRYGLSPYQANVGFTYLQPLQAWQAELAWDTIWHSRGKRTLNQPFTEVPARWVSHASINLYQQEGPWEASLICSNCFDEEYVTSIGNKPLAKINPGVNGDMTAQAAPPRLVTLQLTYRL